MKLQTFLLILFLPLLGCSASSLGQAVDAGPQPPVEEWTGFVTQWKNSRSTEVIFVRNYGGIEDGFCQPAAHGGVTSLIRDMPRSFARAFRRSFDRSEPFETYRLFEVIIKGRRFQKPSEYFFPRAHVGATYDELIELTEPLEFTGRSCRLDFRTPAEVEAGQEKGPDTSVPDPSNSNNSG